MGVVISTSARDNACDAVVDLVDSGSSASNNFGVLEFYTGDFVTLLAECNFSNNAFGNASTGVATANSISLDSSANATGVCERFRFVNTDGQPVLSGTVSATGNGGDIELNTTSITVGDSLSITSLTVTMPAGSF